MSIYCGRDFSAQDIQTITRLMQQDPSLKRNRSANHTLEPSMRAC